MTNNNQEEEKEEEDDEKRYRIINSLLCVSCGQRPPQYFVSGQNTFYGVYCAECCDIEVPRIRKEEEEKDRHSMYLRIENLWFVSIEALEKLYELYGDGSVFDEDKELR
jgi:hypothetical protein